MGGRIGSIYPPIKVAAVYSVGLYELPPKMREFMSNFPAAKVNLEYSRTTRVVRDILSDEIDLGIVAFPESRRGLTIVPMASCRMVLICSADHEYVGRKSIRTKDLMGSDFVQFDRDLPTSKAIDKILKSHNVKINKAAEFDNVETIKRAVESGLGLAIVPHSSVIREEKNEQLVVVKLVEKEWVRSVGAIYRSNRTLSVTAKKFVQFLRCTCGNCTLLA